MKETMTPPPKPLPIIGGYQLISPFKNDNSGTARWTIATKNGKEFFMKQFLSPVMPKAGLGFSEEYIAAETAACNRFFDLKSRLYRAIERSSNGNIIIIQDFFQFEGKYYMVTDKVDVATVDPSDVARKRPGDRFLFLRVLANNLLRVHEQEVVHADMKPTNILVKETPTGKLTAKLIDFDESFLEGEPPPGDIIGFDQVYVSPETYLYATGNDVKPTRKSDVFALGLLFHEYWSGRLPQFVGEGKYAYQILLNGGTLYTDAEIPRDLRAVIDDMLQLDPENRPDMTTVAERLHSSGSTGREAPEKSIWTKASFDG